MRLHKLDSIRGVAAMMVVLGHCYGEQLSQIVIDWHLWPLRIFWNGVDAVSMFFILSGFVLTLQINSGAVTTYSAFVIRRFFRIWPAFAVVIVLSAAVFAIAGYSGFVPDDIGPMLYPSVSGHSVVANLLMATEPNAIDPPVWSLYVEMRVSLLFPLIIILVSRTSIYAAVAIGLAYSVAASRLIHADLGAVVNEFAETSKFVWLFVIGAALAIPNNPVVRAFDRLNGPAKAAILVAGVCLVLYRFAPLSLPAMNYVPSLGIALIFLFCLRSPGAERLLDRPSLLFLGRVSYGLYLVHYPILVFVLSTTALPPFVVTAIVIPTSILAAWVLHKTVELPMMRVGKTLSTPQAPYQSTPGR